MGWATDLLPHEFDFDNRYIMSEEPPVTYFLGSIGDGNKRELIKFKEACEKRNIKFIANNPWQNPLDFNSAKVLVQKSIVAPDIRGSGDPNKPDENGTAHKYIGYIPCRLFKNISYGKLGATNCSRLYDLFGDKVIFCEDEDKLVDLYLEKSKNKDFILEQMKWVQENHTYINRVQDLLHIIQL